MAKCKALTGSAVKVLIIVLIKRLKAQIEEHMSDDRQVLGKLCNRCLHSDS